MNTPKILLLSITMLGAFSTKAQGITDPGIVGTMVLASIVLLVFMTLLVIRLASFFGLLINRKKHEKIHKFSELIKKLSPDEVEELVNKHSKNKSNLNGDELAGTNKPNDQNGLISEIENDVHYFPMFDKKKTKIQKVTVEDSFKRILIAYIGCSVIWLIFGTLIGQYLGMKFVWPELDQVSWLSFGRLRPVHTNAVFWGWASLGMLGLGNYVVTRTCNTRIYSEKLAWVSLILINASVFLGSLSLMNGVNNGGGEYREYIWPIAALFAIGLILSLYNFYKTVSNRTTREIYVSNWYILGACTWTLILVTIAYLPFYQDGLGETIIQGYYMHQGVGMWFMTFTLGLVYYFLPQAVNKPIYSYSLGVLAFWTQMLFYTLIGTHHFIFSPLPWWLQTVAIVFSAGMLIPVIAGTTNFLMTFRGAWTNLKTSYVLPFILVGVLFYFIGSAQGSLQAFRYSNLVWHFNDFNVAHSHITMYGIITFLLWGGIYYLLPRITGNSASELLTGAHFWMAFVGLMLYMFSMMIGGTERGMSWIEGRPFIESIVLMAPYWLWRAIGGSMMFISHLIFGFNFLQMTKAKSETELIESVTEKYNLLEA